MQKASRRPRSKTSSGRAPLTSSSGRQGTSHHSSTKSLASNSLPPVSPFEKATPPNGHDGSSSHSNNKAIITPRRLNGAPTPTQARPTRKVYLIRHGQSQGQAAGRHVRQTDPSLTDCGLTALGQEQARAIPSQFHNPDDYDAIDWVICSPLTRALETAVLGFPDHNILCHYDLSELGSNIPENTPRSTREVLAHLEDEHSIRIAGGTKTNEPSNSTTATSCNSTSDHRTIDLDSLRPDTWPNSRYTSPKVVRRDRVRQVFEWLADTLPDHVGDIAVVCHYHVIRAALAGAPGKNQAYANFVQAQVHPANATVYRCELAADGRLQWLDEENYRSSLSSSGKKAKRFIGKT